MDRSKPVSLRYSVCFNLDTGETVGVQFDYMADAVRFATWINARGEWWEVVDSRTRNVVASSARGTK